MRPDKSKCPNLEQRRVYCRAKQGEQGGLCSKDQNSQIISKEEFAELLESRKDSGMFFEVEISGGTVKTAYLAAQ